MPKVSVCSSVLNQTEWLREMLASVVAQTFKDWELLLVDDGSTEDVAAVVAEFKDERIKLHRFAENKGIPYGINWAFEHAQGEYVQPLAADEALDPKKLEQQVAYLDEHQEIAAVWGLPRTGPLGERPEWEQYLLKAHNRSRIQWMLTMLNLDDIPLGGCSALWRRSIFSKIGYFDTNLKPFVDHEFYCRIIENYEIRILPYRWAISKPNPDAVSMGNTPEKIEQSKKELQYVREKHPIDGTDKATKVTIGIPVKDMARFVLHAIRSVCAQTHKDWELFVLDDGSTDATATLVKGFIKAHPEYPITFMQFEKNQGDRIACNEMLKHATGDYYVSLSADDLIAPTYLERCVAIFQKNAHLEFIASQSDFIDIDGEPDKSEHPAKAIEKASNKSQDEWRARFYSGNVYFGAGMMRTKALRDLGGWKQEYGVLSDYEMYLALVHRCNIHIIEEDLTHTRIHGGNMSMNNDPVWLSKTYAKIRKRYYIPRRKLIIATPFYEARGFSPYIGSMARTVAILTKAGILFEYLLPTGDAYVQRVKNTIMNRFMEDDEATDLLMVDSDMEWPVNAVLEMMLCPEEIIVGSYPMKNAWEVWTSRAKFTKDEQGEWSATERTLPNNGSLIEGEDLAGGFMLIKRSALEKFMAFYPDLRYLDPSADTMVPNRLYTEYFTAGTLKSNGEKYGTFVGEDRQFSRRLKEMGMRWWIYTNVEFGHWGVKQWKGNYKDYLDKCKGAPKQVGGDVATQPFTDGVRDMRADDNANDVPHPIY